MGQVKKRSKDQAHNLHPTGQSQIKTHSQDGGAWSYQQEAIDHRQAVCV